VFRRRVLNGSADAQQPALAVPLQNVAHHVRALVGYGLPSPHSAGACLARGRLR
jgi:hypothetical protein